MNVIVEKLPQCRVSMRVELSKEEVEAERKQIVEAFRSQAKIRGYRPGKIPTPVIEKRFQKEIGEELETRLVRHGCREGTKEKSLDVIAVTSIEDQAIHPDQTFSFTALIQVSPDFPLPEYEGIPIEVAPVEVTEEDVDRHMDLLRQRQSKLVDITGRGLEMGDLAMVHYSATLEGKPLEEVMEGTGYLARGDGEWVRLAPDAFIPGFCDAMVGMSAEQSKTFDVIVPDDFQLEELRGKTLTYQVSVKTAAQQILPEWTDELAKTYGEEETVETLRQKSRKRLEEIGKERQAGEMTTQILEFLDKNVEFELPDRVLAYETQRQVNQIVSRVHQGGMTEEQITGQRDAIIQHASTQAEVNVKTSFILRQIAEKEGVQATEQEIAAFCVQLADSAGISVRKYIRQLRKSDALEEVMDRIVRAKTLAILRGKAKVTEVAPAAAAAEPEATPE